MFIVIPNIRVTQQGRLRLDVQPCNHNYLARCPPMGFWRLVQTGFPCSAFQGGSAKPQVEGQLRWSRRIERRGFFLETS